MSIPVLKVKRLTDTAILPKRMSEEAAGYDVCADEDCFLYPDEPHIVHTGLAFEIPKGYHMELHVRSSLGKKGIRLANCTGIIDSDYRGELLMYLISDMDIDGIRVINKRDRIAQIQLVKDPEFVLEEVDTLGETERGTGGFGSTGSR